MANFPLGNRVNCALGGEIKAGCAVYINGVSDSVSNCLNLPGLERSLDWSVNKVIQQEAGNKQFIRW